MLRALVLILLIVNAAFFAWTRGWLDPVVGVRPDGQREPQRLSQQRAAGQIQVIAPMTSESDGSEVVSAESAGSNAEPASQAASAGLVLADSGSASGAASAPPDGVCLEAGPFPTAARPQIEALLQPVVAAAARDITAVNTPGQWMVYMGPYADNEALARKQEELRRIRGLEFEAVRNPAALVPGIALGRYTQQGDANAALERLRQRGIRTARVVTLRPAGEQLMVRIPKATLGQQKALGDLALPQDRHFGACR